jgi:hypothetical protein
MVFLRLRVPFLARYLRVSEAVYPRVQFLPSLLLSVVRKRRISSCCKEFFAVLETCAVKDVECFFFFFFFLFFFDTNDGVFFSCSISLCLISLMPSPTFLLGQPS